MKEGRLLLVWAVVPLALLGYGLWRFLSKLWEVVP